MIVTKQILRVHMHTLCRSLYQLWASDSPKLFSAYFQTLPELHQFEKDTILGKYNRAR